MTISNHAGQDLAEPSLSLTGEASGPVGLGPAKGTVVGDKCRGFFGRIRCHFEPRYDDERGTGSSFKADKVSMGAADFAKIIEAAKTRTYVCDVCTACGEQRVRPQA